MINVITNHGSSFKGLAAYLLHDVDQADTAERVAWTETHGLATDDPERAWRIMAATAKSQAELKAEAGEVNTGRKSHKHVMHYVLSWHPDERVGLTKDEMIAAAKASMTYMGTYEGEKTGKKNKAMRTQFADEHQAVIVCHDDGPGKAPHIHIMMNRVHPEHGIMLPDSNDYNKLSAWALDYRRAQGNEHLCPERVKNEAKKAQGIVTNNPRKPRNVYEQEQALAEADPGSRKKALLEQQQRRAKELKAKTEAMKQRQAEAVKKLEDRHIAAERAERAKSAEAIKAKTAEIRASYAPKIDALADRHADEKRVFNEARGTAGGHVRNTWAAFKTKQWMTEIRTDPINAMKHGFKLAMDSGLQLRDIEKHQDRETGELNGQRTAEERASAAEVRTDEGFRLDELRQGYYVERNDLILEHDMDQAKNKAEWQQLEQDRRATEAEDERARKAKATPTGDASGPAGGGQQEKKDQGIEPVPTPGVAMERQAPPVHEVPIDEIREAARRAQDMTQNIEQEQQQETDRDGGMEMD